MIRKIVIIHIVSFLTAVMLMISFLFFVSNLTEQSTTQTKIIRGSQQKNAGVIAHFEDGEQAEIDFIASLINSDQITLFGSSELVGSSYAPFVYLPDSVGVPLLAVGSGHHQSFSILCELLGAYEYIESAKICILISPTWFSTEGTNVESFLEYARPNFLSRIAFNETIDVKFKVAIGAFIQNHKADFTSLTATMQYFVDTYETETNYGLPMLYSLLRQWVTSIHPSVQIRQNVSYEIDSIIPTNLRSYNKYDKNMAGQIQNTFLNSITNNSIYVYDDYYTKYVENQGEEGADRIGIIGDYSLSNNPELNDFKLLVDLLDERNADCSFIIQPLNPHFYKNLEYNNPLIDSLTRILNEHNIPFLNMYVTDTVSYEPGILRDIMHTGDLGWMQINNFLINQYVNKN